jgi:TolA-binding protein
VKLDCLKLLVITICFFSLAGNFAFGQMTEPLYEYGSHEYLKSLGEYRESLVRDAEDDIIRSLKEYPDNPTMDMAEILRARIDNINGNYNIADGRLKEFLINRPNSPFIAQAAALRGFLAFENKNYDKAQNLLREASDQAKKAALLRKDKKYDELAHTCLFWRGIAFAHKGKYQEAMPVFEECYQKYPELKYADDALFALGMIAEINRQFETAITYYNTISKRYPYSNTVIAARVREINNYLIMRQPQQALAEIEKTETEIRHIDEGDSVAVHFQKQAFAENATEQLLYLRGEAYNLSKNYQQAHNNFVSFLETFYNSDLANYVLLGNGWSLLNMNENEMAIDQYDKILDSDKDESSVVRNTALLYRTVALKRMGNMDQAQKELSELSVQSTYPYLDLALLELGQIYYEKEELEAARKTLEYAQRESRNAITSVRIHLLLGATYMELRSWPKAVGEYRTAERLALAGSPTFMPQRQWYLAESRLKQGISLVKSHRNSEAIPPLLGFIAENAKDSRMDEALFWLGEAYFSKDMLRNSAETFDKLIKNYPASSRKEEALYGQGWSHFRMREFKKSSAIFDRMINEFPESKYALEVLARQGDGYYVTKNYAKAADAYRRAADISPHSESGQYCAYQHCHALYRLKSYDRALRALMQFVRTYPRSQYASYAMYLNAWIIFQQGNFSESIEKFKFLISAYGQSPLVVKAHYAIGDAYYNTENYELAIEAYRQVIENYPSDPLAGEALKSIQFCYMALGQDDMALKVADEFIETNPNAPITTDLEFGKITMIFQDRKYVDALQEAESFITKHPDSDRNAEVMFLMGKSHISLNDAEKAAQIFDELRKKYPNSKYAAQGILELGLMEKEQMNDPDKADSLLKVVQDEFKGTNEAAQAGYERAWINVVKGDTVKAMDIWTRVGEEYKGTEYADQSIYKIAMTYRLKKEYDSARAKFAYLAGRYDNVLLAAEAQYRIGESYMREENWERAVETFIVAREKFAGYDDWYSLSLMNLGEAYERREEYMQALEVYETLETLRPDDDFGKTAKSRIRNLKKKF